ncbi:proton-coupled amino acid transporter-like protein pathetic [Palaemon carinicauda]|uniref:proton-coupled amino acid transporter-like protein pathetic n=1 Tax=Palaemon carinicauda TaxID=392227 RepID=UPI0035B609E3
MAILPVLLVCFAPNLKSLAPFSLVAGVVQFAGLVIIIYYCARSVSKGAEKVPAFNSWTTMPLYLASTIYAFEGICLVLPWESQMKNPEHLLGYTGVLSTSTFLVICLYATIGFYGYLSYGNTVLGSISLNLPQDEELAQAVKITMAISIYLTYPLQVYIVFDMLQPLINSKFSKNVSRIVADYSSRTCIVLLVELRGVTKTAPSRNLQLNIKGPRQWNFKGLENHAGLTLISSSLGAVAEESMEEQQLKEENEGGVDDHAPRRDALEASWSF